MSVKINHVVELSENLVLLSLRHLRSWQYRLQFICLAHICPCFHSVHQSICASVRVSETASAISPVSIDGFPPNFCHWCISRQRWTD